MIQDMKDLLRGATTLALLGMTLSSATLAVPAQAQTAARPGINLLTNPGHEHPGVYFGGRGEINVTWNWVPFWEESPAGTDPRDQNYRTPEFRPPFAKDYPYRVHSGAGSDRWFNFFALNKKAGIMQYVENVPVGSPVRFTTWMQLWSSNTNDPSIPPKSLQDGNLKVRLCIDQDGGPRDMTDPELVCSDWAQPYDKWVQLSVDAVAKNSAINAVIWSTAEIPVEHNDIYADDSCLEILAKASDAGICMGAGFVPTGAGVQAADPNAASVGVSTTVTATAANPTTAPAATASAAVTSTETTTATTGTGRPTATPRPTVAPRVGVVTVPTTTEPALAVNTTNNINVREKPAQNSKILGTARRGDVLPVVGKSADGKWYQVSYKDGTGWVLGSLSKPNEPAQTAPVVQ